MVGIFAGKGISGTKADSAVKNSVQNEDTAIEIKPVNLPQKHGAKDDSIVISAFFNFIALENVSSSGHLLIILAFLRIVFINITFCYIVADLSKMNDTIRENELLKLKHEYSQQYISSANNEYEVAIRDTHSRCTEKNFVYTYHFNKRKDDIANELTYRHQMLRKHISQQAESILDMRIRYKDEAKRIYGIDACSSELDCRPEVFGNVFRRLRFYDTPN